MHYGATARLGRANAELLKIFLKLSRQPRLPGRRRLRPSEPREACTTFSRKRGTCRRQRSRGGSFLANKNGSTQKVSCAETQARACRRAGCGRSVPSRI